MIKNIIKIMFFYAMIIFLNGCFSIVKKDFYIPSQDNIYQEYPIVKEQNLKDKEIEFESGKGVFDQGPIICSGNKNFSNNNIKIKDNYNIENNLSDIEAKDTMFFKLKKIEQKKDSLKKENKKLKERIDNYEKKEIKNKKIINKLTKENQELKLKLKQAKDIMLKARLDTGVKPITYEVKKKDSLWKIAGYKQIYGNNYKWLEIYHANKEKISNPNMLYPGQVLIIPRYEN